MSYVRPVQKTPLGGVWGRLVLYARLVRLDKPIGMFLLFWPCLWGGILGARGLPPLRQALFFFLGAFFMRSAGCIYNDWVDREVDRHVERTAQRPLAAGYISLWEAFALLAFCLLGGFVCLIQFNVQVIYLGLYVACLIFPYPWLKRITYFPQVYLGLIFNSGVLLGYAATAPRSLELPIFLLYGAGVLWTLVYDTQYAYQDARDDAVLNLKSLALYWGDQPQIFFVACYALILAHLGGVWVLSDMAWPFCFGWLGVLGFFVWQYRIFSPTDVASCGRLFFSHLWVGGLIALTLLAGF